MPAHIAKYDPLYGTSESTAERVMIPMQHTAVAICLNIKNATADAISVKSVRISAPKGVAIAGTHSVNIATGEISASDADNATSNTIELSFEQDIELMADASHTAWIATAPFTIANSGLLLFTIIDTYGNEYDIIKSFPTGREFSSGKIISTTLEVSEVAATTKDITIDFSEASTYPEGVATSISAATENITCQIDGYPVNVYSATGCYYSKSNKRLVLINMNTKSDESEFATISIPQLIGYKISSISISISAESASRVIYLCDNQGTILYEKLGQQSPVNFTTDNIASLITDDSQYHLKFTTTASASFGVNNISVSYTRM